MEGSLVMMSLLVWLFVQVHQDNATIPTADSGAIVALQNKIRRGEHAANMNKLFWEDELAAMADKWVQRCVYGHGGLDDPNSAFVAVGQNLFLSSSKTLNYTAAILNWLGEKQNYNFDEQTCKSSCGHYTQLVWADTSLVGCAWNYCATVKGMSWGGALFICNFAVGGNYADQDPYVKGEPCSFCYDSCEDSLCINDY